MGERDKTAQAALCGTGKSWATARESNPAAGLRQGDERSKFAAARTGSGTWIDVATAGTCHTRFYVKIRYSSYIYICLRLIISYIYRDKKYSQITKYYE
jgi:hypothetical protein